MLTALLCILAYVLIVSLPAFLAVWSGPEETNTLYNLGQSAALAGFTILVLQPLLAARWKCLTRPFGLDIVLRFHRWLALFAGLLLLAHPLLLAVAHDNPGLLISLDLPWYIWLGKILLLVLIVNLVLSNWRRKIHLSFEHWRLLHGIFGAFLLVGAFIHSWVAGSDLQHPLLQTIWIIFLTAVLLILLHHKCLAPFLRRQHAYQVVNVKPEADNVCTLELKPPAGRPIPDYLPGQFHFITLYRDRDLPTEEHHFTISSSPAQTDIVSSTIKNVGDFTSTISQTRVGDTAAVQGPFGRFSYQLHPDEKDLVFIVGGIGITPLMSMLRTMRDRKQDHRVLLLYANRNQSSIIFRDELDEIQAGPHPHLTVVHILSRPENDWHGEKGHIDRDRLDKFIGPDITGKTFYVCGPPPLLEQSINNLKNMNVKDHNIRTELFRFVD